MPRRPRKATTRRSRGQGSKYVRASDQRWVGAVTITPGDRRVVYAHTEEEIDERIAELCLLRDRYLRLGTADQPLGEYLDSWLMDSKRHELRVHSLDTYIWACQTVIDHELGSKQRRLGTITLAELTPAHIRHCYAALQQRMSRTSVAMVHRTLRQALQIPVQDGLLDRNPAASITLPAPLKPTLHIPTREQFAALLDASAGTRWHALWALLGTTGMRLGEALALRWTDRTGDIVYITKTINEPKGGPVTCGPTKNGEDRDVRLTQVAITALAAHRSMQADLAISTLMFPDSRGGYMYRGVANGVLRATLRRAGLPYHRVHDLRHMVATLLLDDGMQAHAVARQLGHRDVTTLWRRYAHLTERQQHEGADRMDALLGR